LPSSSAATGPAQSSAHAPRLIVRAQLATKTTRRFVARTLVEQGLACGQSKDGSEEEVHLRRHRQRLAFEPEHPAQRGGVGIPGSDEALMGHGLARVVAISSRGGAADVRGEEIFPRPLWRRKKGSCGAAPGTTTTRTFPTTDLCLLAPFPSQGPRLRSAVVRSSCERSIAGRSDSCLQTPSRLSTPTTAGCRLPRTQRGRGLLTTAFLTMGATR
jgi:hypothetical protein